MNIGFSQLAISELGYVQSCHFETKIRQILLQNRICQLTQKPEDHKRLIYWVQATNIQLKAFALSGYPFHNKYANLKFFTTLQFSGYVPQYKLDPPHQKIAHSNHKS